MNHIKQNIIQALQRFERGNLKNAAIYLLDTLGYRSDIGTGIEFESPDDFLEQFDTTQKLNRDNSLIEQWQSVEVLFQLTGDAIKETEQLGFIFEASSEAIDNTIIESYLFLAIKLCSRSRRDFGYSRTALSNITREINKLTPMPAMILFQHGQTLTLSVINRRLHKREESRDVLEKVTLIKDIAFATPHRAHIEILFDLSLEELYQKHGCTNFVALHQAWQKTLDSSELNKRFFREVANWYFWAVEQVTFPKDAGEDLETRNATSVIRLITRLIFVWFLQEKGLIPDVLFNQAKLQDILNFIDPKESTYYKAILQNLFFATLNQNMNTEKEPNNRTFRGEGRQHYNITSLYRYKRYFNQPDEALRLFESIPFLNGGLFECLDKPDKDNPKKILRIDGFSDRDDNELVVPDFLFFADERNIDLNKTYGTRNKRYKVRGILNILDSYKFTINENTPIEEEVALDPELLGKVFENLLAAYNPETGATARKQTGSFYTPREIVNYMVDESLIAYLESKLNIAINDAPAGLTNPAESRLRHLIAYNDEPHRFNEQEVERLIEAIDTVKILDPACGSGAFPMGILHKLVYILGKLDPGNEQWKARQIAKANEIPDSTIRETVVAEIEQAFERNELDYGRKLYLIENCVYGVDIQPIATQIAKLRFFISLVVDQKIDDNQENRGILPLPNLETKFVAANTLIGIDTQLSLRTQEIAQKEKELADVRRRHFTARTPGTKSKYRNSDAQIRSDISELLKKGGFPSETTEKLAFWDPYDQNASADFFDTEWMFGINEGFNIVIGNPPYISALNFASIYGAEVRRKLNISYDTAKGSYDIYVLFLEKGMNLICPTGRLTYITPNKYLSAKYAATIREYILNNGLLEHLVDLSSINVFKEASVYPVISFISKETKLKRPVRVLLPKDSSVEQFQIPEFDSVEVAHKMLEMLTEYIWGFLLSNYVELLSKIIVGTEPLEMFGNINATSTAAESDEYGAFITNEHQAGSLKVLNTGTIDKYVSQWGIREMRHAGKGFLTPYLPLEKASVNMRRKNMYKSPKIIFAKIAKICEAYMDLNGEYASLNTNCFYNPREGVSLQFIGAFCNSKLFMFFYQQLFGALRMSAGYYQFQAPQLRNIPFKIVSASQQAPFIALVDKILAAKRTNPDADTSVLEREIDQLFYELYNLTEKEITIVEESVSTNTAIKGEIDINTASPAELALLDGIGNKTAELIIAGRPYQEVEDLLKVRGIGEKALERIRDQITVE